jgi:hypothetical protein
MNYEPLSDDERRTYDAASRTANGVRARFWRWVGKQIAAAYPDRVNTLTMPSTMHAGQTVTYTSSRPTHPFAR